MLVDWGTVSIQILTSLISSSLIIFSITTFINTIYYIPDINIKEVQEESNSTVEVKNTGRAPAKHVILTVFTPEKIVNYNGNYSTENITITEFNKHILKIYAPRLIHGEGSFIKLFVSHDIRQNISNFTYSIYATYDEGSIKYPDGKSDIFSSYIFIIILLIIGIAVFIGPYIYLRKRKERIRKKYIESIHSQIKEIKNYFLKDIENKEVYFKDNITNMWTKESNSNKQIYFSNYDEFKLLEKVYNLINDRDNKLSDDDFNIDEIRSLNEKIKKSSTNAEETIKW